MRSKSGRPYFDAWLKRTGKALSASGRLTQVATLLATEEGGSADDWRARLRDLLEGNETQSMKLLTRIDALLAPPRAEKNLPDGGQEFSF
ncbi:MAG: hypothetical protein V4733_11375 [Verrucomicrobiota bacterium]